jgi:hypothetical protein
MMNGLVDMHIAAGNRLRAENEQLQLRIKQLELKVSELQETLETGEWPRGQHLGLGGHAYLGTLPEEKK